MRVLGPPAVCSTHFNIPTRVQTPSVLPAVRLVLNSTSNPLTIFSYRPVYKKRSVYWYIFIYLSRYVCMCVHFFIYLSLSMYVCVCEWMDSFFFSLQSEWETLIILRPKGESRCWTEWKGTGVVDSWTIVDGVYIYSCCSLVPGSWLVRASVCISPKYTLANYRVGPVHSLSPLKSFLMPNFIE